MQDLCDILKLENIIENTNGKIVSATMMLNLKI